MGRGENKELTNFLIGATDGVQDKTVQYRDLLTISNLVRVKVGVRVFCGTVFAQTVVAQIVATKCPL